MKFLYNQATHGPSMQSTIPNENEHLSMECAQAVALVSIARDLRGINNSLAEIAAMMKNPVRSN